MCTVLSRDRREVGGQGHVVPVPWEGGEVADHSAAALALPREEMARAMELALRALARRDHSEAELRALLERRRCAPAAIEAVVARLRRDGYVDDRAFARRFASDKRELERWGTERIVRELRRRGIAADVAAAAVADIDATAELEAARRLVSERYGPPRDDATRRRAWSFLVRRGYPCQIAYDAVRSAERGARGDAA